MVLGRSARQKKPWGTTPSEVAPSLADGKASCASEDHASGEEACLEHPGGCLPIMMDKEAAASKGTGDIEDGKVLKEVQNDDLADGGCKGRESSASSRAEDMLQRVGEERENGQEGLEAENDEGKGEIGFRGAAASPRDAKMGDGKPIDGKDAGNSRGSSSSSSNVANLKEVNASMAVDLEEKGREGMESSSIVLVEEVDSENCSSVVVDAKDDAGLSSRSSSNVANFKEEETPSMVVDPEGEKEKETEIRGSSSSSSNTAVAHVEDEKGREVQEGLRGAEVEVDEHDHGGKVERCAALPEEDRMIVDDAFVAERKEEERGEEEVEDDVVAEGEEEKRGEEEEEEKEEKEEKESGEEEEDSVVVGGSAVIAEEDRMVVDDAVVAEEKEEREEREGGDAVVAEEKEERDQRD